MSDTLRATSTQYGRRIEEIDRQIKGHEYAVGDLRKQRADVETAKKAVDEQIAKMPKEKPPVSKAPAAAASIIALLLSLLFAAVPATHAADISPTASGVAMSADGQNHKLIRTAGVDIAPGQLAYLDVTTNTEKLCDNNASLAASKCEGIAVTSASSGQPVVICTQDSKFKINATLVIGDTLWSSGTAGGITKTAADNVTGMYVSVLGVAVSTSEFNFKIIRADAIKP